MAYISRGPMRDHEKSRTPSINESLKVIQAHIDAKKRKANWRKPVDPNAFYNRNGLPSDAEASQATAAKRYDPHGND
jgi:hypothetical protein